MTTPLTVGGLYQCRIWGLQAEQAAVNTIYYLVTNTTGAAVNDTDLARVLELNVEAIYKGYMSTDSSFRGVQVILNNPAPGSPAPAPVFSNVFAGAGALAPPDCPRQVSGIIEWTTAFAGRRYRGRIYPFFPPTAQVASNGIPSAAWQTNMINLGTAMLGLTLVNNVGSTGSAATALYLHHRAGKSPTPLATPVTGKVIPPKFATQKRRGSYGRPNSSPI